MTVYVDPAVWPFGRMLMCHMWADTEAELLEMADKIGVARKWIQGHPTLSFGKHRKASWVHFDIAKSKRALAVAAGAVETDRFGPLEWEAKRNLASEDPAVVARGKRMMDGVELCRGLRAVSGNRDATVDASLEQPTQASTDGITASTNPDAD